MKTESEPRRDQHAAPGQQVLVWDLPVRVFHWLIVLCFAGAWLTSESEQWRLLHVTLGYTMGILVAFRLVWGVVGTRYARFANFVRGPSSVASYLGSLLRGQPRHYIGHNPAGAVAILALLGLAAAVVASGWATYSEVGGEAFEEVHEAVASVMLAVVGVHIAGVLAGSWLHRENLVRSMITGRKAAAPDSGISRPRRAVAGLLIAGLLAFWWLQWENAPAANADGSPPARHGQHHGDDD